MLMNVLNSFSLIYTRIYQFVILIFFVLLALITNQRNQQNQSTYSIRSISIKNPKNRNHKKEITSKPQNAIFFHR